VEGPARWPVSKVMLPLGALPTAPSVARAYARTMLATWGMGDFSAVTDLIVSELVTNGVNASTGPHGAPLYVDGRMLVVQSRLMTEVWDQAPRVPVRKSAGLHDENLARPPAYRQPHRLPVGLGSRDGRSRQVRLGGRQCGECRRYGSVMAGRVRFLGIPGVALIEAAGFCDDRGGFFEYLCAEATSALWGPGSRGPPADVQSAT
jgi:hypothetical protein